MLITLALDVEELEDLINGLLQAGLVMSAEELEKALLQLLKKNILQSIELSWMRELDTELAEVYSVEIPVITAWVRDDNYVHSTKEIFLGEPSLEGFLHQFRHHLQNKAREPQYKYLLVENYPKADYRIPYKDCMYRMYGEDDARAWARMVIELAS